MSHEMYNTKDQTRARGGVGRLAWSFVRDMSGSIRFARCGGFAFFPMASSGLGVWGHTLQELTHIVGGERPTVRRAMFRRIQIRGDLARRPTCGSCLTNAFQKRRQIRQLAPGAHRSPQMMFGHGATSPMQLDLNLVGRRRCPQDDTLQEQTHDLPFVLNRRLRRAQSAGRSRAKVSIWARSASLSLVGFVC